MVVMTPTMLYAWYYVEAYIHMHNRPSHSYSWLTRLRLFFLWLFSCCFVIVLVLVPAFRLVHGVVVAAADVVVPLGIASDTVYLPVLPSTTNVWM